MLKYALALVFFVLGILRENKGVLKEIYGIVKEIDGILKEINGTIKEINLERTTRYNKSGNKVTFDIFYLDGGKYYRYYIKNNYNLTDVVMLLAMTSVQFAKKILMKTIIP